MVDDGRPIGLVAERNIVIAPWPTPNDDVRSHQVKEVMETDLHVASLNDDTADLAAVMTQFRIRHLPVVDESGRLLAIVSIGDVVKARLDTPASMSEITHQLRSAVSPSAIRSLRASGQIRRPSPVRPRRAGPAAGQLGVMRCHSSHRPPHQALPAASPALRRSG